MIIETFVGDKYNCNGNFKKKGEDSTKSADLG